MGFAVNSPLHRVKIDKDLSASKKKVLLAPDDLRTIKDERERASCTPSPSLSVKKKIDMMTKGFACVICML